MKNTTFRVFSLTLAVILTLVAVPFMIFAETTGDSQTQSESQETTSDSQSNNENNSTNNDSSDELSVPFPNMNAEVIEVSATQAQLLLDGAFGSIEGKTVKFMEDITTVLDLARPTKYEGSKTTYYNYHQSAAACDSDPTPWSSDISSIINSHSKYYRTLSNVTFTSAEGVTIAGFKFSAGHAHQTSNFNDKDYVRDVEIGNDNAFYRHSSLSNITFDSLTISGTIICNLYLNDCTVKNITVKNCTFVGETSKMNSSAFVAVEMKSDTEYFTNTIVSNCNIANYYQGVFIQGINGATINNNTIHNTCHNAIAIQSSTSNHITGTVAVYENYITNTTDRAIRIHNALSTAKITINNNIMVNCDDGEGQLIKATTIPAGATVNLDNNYWDGKSLETVIGSENLPSNMPTGIINGTFKINVNDYVAEGKITASDVNGNYVVIDSIFSFDTISLKNKDDIKAGIAFDYNVVSVDGITVTNMRWDYGFTEYETYNNSKESTITPDENMKFSINGILAKNYDKEIWVRLTVTVELEDQIYTITYSIRTATVSALTVVQ